MGYQEIFQSRYDKLNEEQKNAVDTIEGPVLVVAGPGSGKTELLAVRTANILKNTDTPASSILLLTFTEAAAANMRKRLAGLIGSEAYKVAIHTFHSFGTEIINHNPEYFYQGAFKEPLSELNQTEILENILKDLKFDSVLKSYHPVQGYTYLRDISRIISDLKKAGISPEKLKKITAENDKFLESTVQPIAEFFEDRISKKTIEKVPKLIEELSLEKEENGNSLQHKIIESLTLAYADAQEENSTKPITEWKKSFTKKDDQKHTILKDYANAQKMSELAEVYKKYQNELEQRGNFDFEDMILDTVQAMEENPELAYNIQERYLYVMVDEFQDTSGVQMKLLDLVLNNEVTEGRPNILAVGDDDQSIFKFQGANLENLMSFHTKFRDPELIVLTKNYRSTPGILKMARSIILQGEDRLETRIEEISKPLIPANTSLPQEEIIEQEFQTNLEQLVFIAKEIQGLIQDSPASEIAIIGPKHRLLEDVAQVLREFKIPINYERKKNLLEEPLITEILEIAEFAESLNSKTQKDADDLLPSILSFDFLEISSLDIWQISKEAYKGRRLWLEVMLESTNPKIQNFAKFLIDLAPKCNHHTAEEIIDFITGTQPLAGYNTPYKNYYFSNDLLKESPGKYLSFLSDLQGFIDAVRKHTTENTLTTSDLINFIQLHKTHRLPLRHAENITNENGVNLLTAHKAKGQEFDTVFLLSCSDQSWVKGSSFSKISLPKNLPIAAEAENNDDKLRLFYVAFTRAKHRLYITQNLYDDTGREQNKIRFLADENAEEIKGLHPEKLKQMVADFAEKENLKQLFELKFNIQKRNFDFTTAEQNVLAELTSDYKLAVTHLLNFLNVKDGGPEKFFTQNLIRFPQRLSIHASYGNAIHSALHHLQKDYKRKQSLPDLKFVTDSFEKALIKERLNENDFEQMMEKGLSELTSYYEKRAAYFDPYDQPEFNFRRQNVKLGEAELTGTIDKMNFDTNLAEITVTDYKTGKPLGSWQGRDDYQKIKLWKFKTQLLFYKLLIENSRDFGGKYRVNTGIIEFITPLNDQISRLILEIDKEEVERLKALAKIVFTKIKNLDFPDISQYEESFYGIQSFEEDLLQGL